MGFLSNLVKTFSLKEMVQPVIENIAIKIATDTGFFSWLVNNMPGGGSVVEMLASGLNIENKAVDQFLKRMGSAAKDSMKGEKALSASAGGFEGACTKLLSDKDMTTREIARIALSFIAHVGRCQGWPLVDAWYERFHELLRSITPSGLQVFGLMAAYDFENGAGLAVLADAQQGGADAWVSKHSAAIEVLRVMFSEPKLFREMPEPIRPPEPSTVIQDALDDIESFLTERIRRERNEE